ncbi:MAG: hypothetical protein U0166_26485 [Acidobacteriota bacterium]
MPGVPYAGAIIFSQGLPPYSASLISGKMPAGLQLQPDGSVIGTPMGLGRAELRVDVADAHGLHFVEDVTISIVPAVVRQIHGTVMVSPWGAAERRVGSGEGLNRGDVVRALAQSSITLATPSGTVKVRANMSGRVESDGRIALSRVRGSAPAGLPELWPLANAVAVFVLVLLLGVIWRRRSLSVDMVAPAPPIVLAERVETKVPRRAAQVRSILREIRDENRRA